MTRIFFVIYKGYLAIIERIRTQIHKLHVDFRPLSVVFDNYQIISKKIKENHAFFQDTLEKQNQTFFQDIKKLKINISYANHTINKFNECIQPYFDYECRVAPTCK